MRSQAKQSGQPAFNTDATATVDRADFDRWAKAVREQMLECLRRKETSARRSS